MKIELTEHEIFTIAELRLLISTAESLAAPKAPEILTHITESSVKSTPMYEAFQAEDPELLKQVINTLSNSTREKLERDRATWSAIHRKLHLYKSLI